MSEGWWSDGHVLDVTVWASSGDRPATGTEVVALVQQALTLAGVTATVRWERLVPARQAN